MALYGGMHTLTDTLSYPDSPNLQVKEMADRIIKDYVEQNREAKNIKREDTINFNEHLKSLINYNYIINKPSSVSEDVMRRNKEQSMLTKEIVKDLTHLYENEDIRDQISYCVSISEKTMKLLKMMPESAVNNYKKDVLHLFYQAIKRNYARMKFNEKQINLLLELVKKSQSTVVEEKEFLELDRQLYINRLDIFPEEE